MVKIILVQSSLNPESRTAIVIQQCAEFLTTWGIDNKIIDLRNYNIPFCDGRKLKNYGPDVQALHRELSEADAYIIGYPVYLYTFSGVLKNFFDIFGGATKHKYYGIVATAGGQSSYLSSKELVSILSFDLDMTVVQPTVYSHEDHYENEILTSPYVHTKIQKMVQQLVRITQSTVEILSSA